MSVSGNLLLLGAFNDQGFVDTRESTECAELSIATKAMKGDTFWQRQ